MKFSGGILLDGVPCRSTQVVLAGQVLTLTARDRLMPPPKQASTLPEAVYEDEHYLIVDKPAPLASIDSSRSDETLQGRVYLYLGKPDSFVYRPVNRLDKGTSGLMLIAKSGHAQHLAQRLLHMDGLERTYLAIVDGSPPESSGVIRLPIGRADGVRRMVEPNGRPCVTHYEVIMTHASLSLIRLRLETGRTHQIRVHMQALGCPILGDYLYGRSDPRLPGRFALHSCVLQFKHPFTGASVVRESPLPVTLQSLLRA